MFEVTPSSARPWTARRVVLTTLVVAGVLLAFYMLLRFYLVIFILFVAIVIAVAIRPIVEWLYRRGVPRALGVITVYLGLLLLTVAFFWVLAPLLVEQVTTIGRKLPEYYKALRSLLLTSPSALIQQAAFGLPEQPTLSLPAPGGSGGSLSDVGRALNLLVAAGRTVFVGASILVLAFYWTLDGERSTRQMLLRVPSDRRETARELIGSMEEKVGAYVRGVIILSAAVAVMATAAYLIIGLPYALVLGIVAGVLEALPVIGPVLGAFPPLLLALSLEPAKAVWVLLAVVIIQQAEGNFLVPRVMDRSVGVNAIVTILAITGFGSLFGLGGAIMAIPLAAVIQVLIDRFLFNGSAPDVELPDGRNQYSILRYQAQELVQDVRKQVRRKEDLADGETDRLEDMIEAIATDLDSALAQAENVEAEA